MQIKVCRIEDGPAKIQTYDPSMNDGAGGVCREIDLNVGQEVTLTLPGVHDVTGIEVGEVCQIGEGTSAPAGEGAPDEAAAASGEGEESGGE
jgi:hypothetical protein